MIGNDHQRAVFRYLFQIVRRDCAANIQVFQHLFDRIEPLQVTMAGGKLLKLFLMEQFF